MKALITGITGQDGSYLAEFLKRKGYEIHGLKRRSSSINTERIDRLYTEPQDLSEPLFTMHYADLSDAGALTRLFNDIRPDEVYNLAAQSHVKVSFDVPEYTADIVALGTLRLLETIRSIGFTRFYQASSSEMFGATPPMQNERSPFHPLSPYATAKVFAHGITVNYREAYNLHASCGILFNHESPRRGETFVTRKVCRAVARIHYKLQDRLYLGYLDPRRDWGFAGDYVGAMWAMLQQDEPDDYVIGTGESHTVREFVEAAFAIVGLDYREYVVLDPRYCRLTDVPDLCADASKARRVLGWEPQVTFDQLVRMMVQAELTALEAQGIK